MSEGFWTPVRYVQFEQRCWFCRARIPKASPGTRTGERGTKAYCRMVRGVVEWECMPCREEGSRAERAREAIEGAVRMNARPMKEGEPFDVLVDTRFRVIKGGRALWEGIQAGRVASLRIVAVPVAKAREMERAAWATSSSVGSRAKGSTSGGTSG